MQVKKLAYKNFLGGITLNRILNEKAENFLETANMIFITGEIDAAMYRDVVSRVIYYASESRDPIYLVINSEGGSVYSTFGIISALKSVSNEVVGIANGMVKSGALLLLANCDYRFAFDGSTFMHHLPWVSGIAGTGIDIESVSKELKNIKSHKYFKRANELMPKDVDLNKNIDYNFFAEEALESGLVTKIIKEFDDIVPDKYAEIIKQGLTEQVVGKILEIYEEFDNEEIFKQAIEMISEMVSGDDNDEEKEGVEK